MGQVITIGLDIAKSVFQVHGVDAVGEVVIRRQVRRGQMLSFFAAQHACLIGIEACATAHHWGRKLAKLGHRVRLMPPSYVKPYVKRQKNDAADVEAICEAVTRPSMRFVEVKSPEQQSVMVLHRVRMMLMRQRISLSNAIRGHMAEFGLVAPIGREGLHGLVAVIVTDEHVPEEARVVVSASGTMSRSSARRTSLGSLAMICLPDLSVTGILHHSPESGRMACAVDGMTVVFRNRSERPRTRLRVLASVVRLDACRG